MLTNKACFEFYFNVFCNGRQGAIPAESFDRCLMIADRELNKYISVDGRISDFEDDVCMCLCELAEFVFQHEKTGDVKSESIDGYSVSFDVDGRKKSRVPEIIFRWLGKSGLLYAGVY